MTNTKSPRELDIAFNFLQYCHTVWPIHEHYFCNETCLSILLNKKIQNYVVLSSALPEYIDKRFKNIIFNRTQDRNKHIFKLLYNGLQITLICIDEYPWLEMYKENYVNCNVELLFMDWESQVYDPYKVEDKLLKDKELEIYTQDYINLDEIEYFKSLLK